MLDPKNLPVDLSVIAQDTVDIVEDTDESAADTGVILAQLDPTEIDLSTGQPRWTEGQRALILKAQDALTDWRE